MTRFSRRFLLAVPLVLLGVGWIVRARTPRPSSPADAWLWERAERANSLRIDADTRDFDSRGNPTPKVWLQVKDRSAIRSLLRALDCEDDFSPALAKRILKTFNHHFLWTIELDSTSPGILGTGAAVVVVRQQKGDYLLRFVTSNGMPVPISAALLRPDAAQQVLKIVRSLMARARSHGPCGDSKIHIERMGC